MKKTFISILFFIVLGTVPATAQWKNIGPWEQTFAFGVHDTSFFWALSDVVQQYTPWGSRISNSILSQSVTSFASLGRYFYAGYYRSSNNGQSWSELQMGAPIATNGIYLFGTTVSTVYRSLDSGKSWQAVPGPEAKSFAAFGICIFDNTGKSIWSSLDTGGHWQQLPSAPSHIAQILVMKQLLYAVDSSGHVSVSTDSGSDWNAVTVDSMGTSEYVTCLATDGRNLFAGTREGVFLSRDSGETWKAVNDNLSYKSVQILGVFDTLLFANDIVGPGYELYLRSIPEMVADTGKSLVQTVPTGDSIEIYPNPSLGTVTISTSIPILGIQVTDILGEEVPRTAYRVTRGNLGTLDLSNGQSGTYFIEIQTGNGTILKKVTIER